jgi:hypothetical protein
MSTLRSQLLLALALVFLVLALLAVGSERAYSSDDVAQQNAVASITLHSKPVIDLPQNTYTLKLPLYAALQDLPVTPSARLVLTTLLLNIAGFLLFYYAAQSFIRAYAPARVANLAPILWLPSLGVSLAGVLANPNSRNLEIGLAFGVLALLARWYNGAWPASAWRGTALAGLFAALLGLLFYDDPYFIYMLALPLLLLFGGKWLLLGKDRRPVILSMGVLAALVFAQAWYWILWLLGIHAGQEGASFATLPAVAHNAQLFVRAVLDLFNANIFGRSILSLQSLAPELNLLLLIATLLAPFLLLSAKVRRDMWKVFLILQPPFLALAFIAGSTVVDTASGRYLVPLPFYTALILAVVVMPLLTTRMRNVLAGALLLVTILNVASTIRIYLGRGDNANAENQEIAHIAEAHHLTKGYASYWNADINQYYSDNKVLFIQSGCSRTTGVKPYRFLLNEQVLHRQASNSFYLFDPAATRCTEADFARYLGEPRGVVGLSGRKQLLLYDYDITTRMRLD